MTRSANAVWQGGLREGKGDMRVGSGAFDVPFSFKTRFGDTPGTNPEELIGAAHAGCFSMAFSGALEGAGFTPERVATVAKVTVNQVEGGFAVTKIELHMEAKVPGIDEATFQQVAANAKANCPISKALAAVPEITLDAKLG